MKHIKKFEELFERFAPTLDPVTMSKTKRVNTNKIKESSLPLGEFLSRTRDIIKDLFPETHAIMRVMYYWERGLIRENSNLGLIFYPTEKFKTYYNKNKALLYQSIPRTLKVQLKYRPTDYNEYYKNHPERQADIEYWIDSYNELNKELGKDDKVLNEKLKPISLLDQASGSRTVFGSKKLQDMLTKIVIPARSNAIIWGVPGIGKTQVLNQLTWANAPVAVISKHLSEILPEELAGVRIPDIDRQVVSILKSDILDALKLEASKKRPFVLFLDELTRAKKAVRNVAMPLFSSRVLGPYKIPSNTVIMAASNRRSDDPEDDIATLSIAENLRAKHINYVPLLEDFISWGENIPEKGKKVFWSESEGEIDFFDKKLTAIHPVLIQFLRFEQKQNRVAYFIDKDTGEFNPMYTPTVSDPEYVDSFMDIKSGGRGDQVFVHNAPRAIELASNELYTYLNTVNKDLKDGVYELSDEEISDVLGGEMKPETINHFKDFLSIAKVFKLENIDKIFVDPLNAPAPPTKEEYDKLSKEYNLTDTYESFRMQLLQIITMRSINFDRGYQRAQAYMIKHFKGEKLNESTEDFQAMKNLAGDIKPKSEEDLFIDLMYGSRSDFAADYINGMKKYIDINIKDDANTGITEEQILEMLENIESNEGIPTFAKRVISLEATPNENFRNIINEAKASGYITIEASDKQLDDIEIEIATTPEFEEMVDKYLDKETYLALFGTLIDKDLLEEDVKKQFGEEDPEEGDDVSKFIFKYLGKAN